MLRFIYIKLPILLFCFLSGGLSAQVWISQTGTSSPREIDPLLRPDGRALFFTRPDYATNKGTDDAADIWIINRNDDGSWGRALNPGSPINTFAHDRPLGISPDGSRLAVLRTGGASYIDLLETSGRNWRIIDSWPLPDDVDQRFDITFNANAQTIIYSAYNNGQLDLFRRVGLSNGRWAATEPLAQLNGPGNETGPSLSPDGRTLYFRRDGGRWFLQPDRGERAVSTGLSAGIRQFTPALGPREAVAVVVENGSIGERLKLVPVSHEDLPAPARLTRRFLPDALPPGEFTTRVGLEKGDFLVVRPDALRRYSVFLRQGELLANSTGIDPLNSGNAPNLGSLATIGGMNGAATERSRLEAGISRRQDELNRLDAERRKFDLVAPKTEDPELAALRTRYQNSLVSPADTMPPRSRTSKGDANARRYAAELDELERMKAKFRKQQNDKLDQRNGGDYEWSREPEAAIKAATGIGETYRPLDPDRRAADPERAYQDSIRLSAEISAGLASDKAPRAYQRQPWENEVRRGLPRNEPVSANESAVLDQNYQRQLDELEAMRAKLRQLDAPPTPVTSTSGRKTRPSSSSTPDWSAKSPAARQPAVRQNAPAPRRAADDYPTTSTSAAEKYRQPAVSETGVLPASISFIPNTAYPDGAGYTGLDQLIGIIQRSTSVVEIRVHTPKTLDRRAAQLLSEERAMSITNFLREQGVAPGNYRVIGFGNNLTGLEGERVEVLR